MEELSMGMKWLRGRDRIQTTMVRSEQPYSAHGVLYREIAHGNLPKVFSKRQQALEETEMANAFKTSSLTWVGRDEIEDGGYDEEEYYIDRSHRCRQSCRKSM